MLLSCKTAFNARRTLPAALLTILLALPACAYDFPLTENSIRDAYFLGTRQTSLGPDFLAAYARVTPELHVGDYKSTITIETPFSQVAILAGKKLNYSAQDAVQDFSKKRLSFRAHMDILYMLDAAPNAIRFNLIQNKKEPTSDSIARSSYFPAGDEYTRPPRLAKPLSWNSTHLASIPPCLPLRLTHQMASAPKPSSIFSPSVRCP